MKRKERQGRSRREVSAGLQRDKVLMEAEKWMEGEYRSFEGKELLLLANGLVAIYDNVFHATETRERAAEIARELAVKVEGVVDVIIASAKKYAKMQHIDDAFPFSPNSFEVLGQTGKGEAKVIDFLRQTVAEDWGIPRWEAIRALCRLEDTEAERIIEDVVEGKYPPRQLALQDDLMEIRSAKGEEFLARHLG